jgi:hypothetical protein
MCQQQQHNLLQVCWWLATTSFVNDSWRLQRQRLHPVLQRPQQYLQEHSNTQQIKQGRWHHGMLSTSARLAALIWALLLRCLGFLGAASASRGCWQN